MLQSTQNNGMDYYSRDMSDPRFLAPAVTHRFASVMMLLSKMVGGALLLRKTLAFLSFHTVHETSMVSEAMAFLCVVPPPARLSHHFFTKPSKCQEVTSKFSSRNFSLTKPQSLNVKRHLKKRCAPHSCTLLQRGQSPQFIHPRLSNLSTVQMRS